ncbi:MAG: hypothetical protein Q4E89_03145 [Eubacteriales bacterium]|nr:hypothetical protein [Eubacteriales bacterium]
MEQPKNSLELWNQIYQDCEYIYKVKRRIPNQQWRGERFLELVDQVTYEFREQKTSALAEGIGQELYRTRKIPYSYLMILRAVWSFQKRPAELNEIQYFLDPSCTCDSNEIEELKKLLANLPLKYDGRKLEEKRAEIEALGRKAAEIESEINLSRRKKQEALDEELRRERERLQAELTEEFAKSRTLLLAQAKQEIEQRKQEELHKIQASAVCQLRQEENEAYLREVRADIERRTQFEDRLCEDMRGVSRSFKSTAGDLVTELEGSTQELLQRLVGYTEKTILELRRSAANAANAVVDTERRIRRDDTEALLWNFCELQEQLFYNVHEEELGLKTTQIEKYLKRFLKVLNRMGYEHYIPKQGERFDEEIHEEGEPSDFGAEAGHKREEDTIAPQSGETETFEKVFSALLGTEAVSGVIHYGFKREEEICVKAKVTVGRRMPAD